MGRYYMHGHRPSGPQLLYSDDFNTLDIASNANPNAGWRPDAIWQSLVMGYRDFAGTNWNINPNDPPFAAYPAFTINNSVLTISSFRTPPALVAPIRVDLIAQGNSGLPDPAWCGGLLMSNSAVRKFLYGYFEFKVQWPNPGKGMFPALWLFSSDLGADVLNKGFAEIDILEMYGAGNLWYTNLHMRDNNNIGSDATLGPHAADTAGWHLYGLDWQPSYLRFYYDNVLLYEVTGSNATWFNTHMNIMINFAMDAPWFGALASDGTTPSPMAMNIDYVKVWASKP